jgi:hypothetical protein
VRDTSSLHQGRLRLLFFDVLAHKVMRWEKASCCLLDRNKRNSGSLAGNIESETDSWSYLGHLSAYKAGHLTKEIVCEVGRLQRESNERSRKPVI